MMCCPKSWKYYNKKAVMKNYRNVESPDVTPQEQGTEEDVREGLQEMCSCMRRRKEVTEDTQLYRTIHSWYMPRNEQDVMCYMKRYNVWRKLPTLIAKRMKKKEEKV